MKKFNTTAICIPSLHYMVDLTDRLKTIQKMIENGDYFTINRARQYGKTTLLNALAQCLKGKYYVISLDFQELSESKFKSEDNFSRAFASRFIRAFMSDNDISYSPSDNVDEKISQNKSLFSSLDTLASKADNVNKSFELMELFDCIGDICSASDRKVVLMIDEVDSATNNQVFLDFLAQLRSDYIKRMTHPTFQSVILAGVYDVKNLKRKLRSDDDSKVNSPWNIAADFNVDMSFQPHEIAGMLNDYSREHGVTLDTNILSQQIYDYSHGYPFLVSRLCQIIDEQLLGKEGYESLQRAWSKTGVDEAARRLEREKNTLFESLTAKLINSRELNDMVQRILFNGAEVPFVSVNPEIEQAAMFGFIREQDDKAVIANRIFETVLYNLFLTTENEQKSDIFKAGEIDKPKFVKNGHLDMDLILKRFTETFNDLYGDRDEKFLEEDGRRYFLLYLKPIINGTGNYYIESRTRNNERTDVIVDYLGEQFIIELKIWRGNSYNERGEKQLIGYLEHYHLKKGYMVSFCFNKNKKTGISEIALGDRCLVEAIV